jgi:hypothetical protein
MATMTPADTIREATLHVIEGVGTLIPGHETHHADDCPGCKVLAALTELEAKVSDLEDLWMDANRRAVAAEAEIKRLADTLREIEDTLRAYGTGVHLIGARHKARAALDRHTKEQT